MIRRHRAAFIILFITIFAYVLSWKCQRAVDYYRLHIFPLGTNTLARVLSVIPFSVGEILIIAAVFFLLISFIITILKLLFRNKFQKSFHICRKIFRFICIWVIVTETFFCFVMYHASTVEETYFADAEIGEDALVNLYEMLVNKANGLSEKMQRDTQGNVMYDGDLYAQCKAAMQNLGEEYPYLKGYYPDPKPIANSGFMSQQYLAGIYFPFTLEANYNQTMYIMNRPATICHELSHLKGVILEDEANYFGFLACIRSEDGFIQYSGYLSVLSYVSREVRKNIPLEVRQEMTEPNTLVQNDVVFLTDEAWEKVEKEAVISTETANQVTDTFLESNLKSNGVKNGMESYSQVVRLLLKWYEHSN